LHIYLSIYDKWPESATDINVIKLVSPSDRAVMQVILLRTAMQNSIGNPLIIIIIGVVA